MRGRATTLWFKRSARVYAEDAPDEIVELNDLNDFATRMSMSRIYGGVHFRTSNEHAEWIGRETSARVLDAFAPL